MEEGRLANKVTVITGGGNGIGRATALLFAKEGASIVVVDRNLDCAELVASKIKEFGSSAICVKADVRSVQDLNEMANTAMDIFGSVNVLP